MAVHNKKKEHLCTLEMFVDLDVKDKSLKNELISQIKKDTKEIDDGNSPKFNRYFENRDKFSNLGKAHLDIMKAEKTLRNFHGSVYTMVAVSKFKRMLSKNTEQTV